MAEEVGRGNNRGGKGGGESSSVANDNKGNTMVEDCMNTDEGEGAQPPTLSKMVRGADSQVGNEGHLKQEEQCQ